MNSDQAHDQSQTGTVEEVKAPYARPVLVNMGNAEVLTEGAATAAQVDSTSVTADS